MVVEYVNGEMLVAETNIVTNHYLADCTKKGVGSEQSHQRFDWLSQFGPDFVLGKSGDGQYRWGPGFPFQEVRALLASVAQSQYPKSDGDNDVTLWSIYYEPGNQKADFYFREDFDHGHRLFLHPEINIKNKFISDTPVIFFD